MPMQKRRIPILLIIPVLLMTLSCKKEEQIKEAAPQVVEWWHINTDSPSSSVINHIAQDFMSVHPDVDVQITMIDNIEYTPKLDLKLSAQDPPAIFHSWGGGGMEELAKAGYLKDITAWVTGDQWESKINAATLDLYSYNGKIYGFPQDLGAVGFWYNKELLLEAGYKDFPTDWETFKTMLDDLKEHNITPISLGIADNWPVMYYWVYLAMRIGGADIYQNIYNHKISFENPAMIQAGYLMQELYKQGVFQSTSLGDDFPIQSRYMGDGLCAMQLMGQWALALQAQNSDKKDELSSIMGFAPFPEVARGKGSIKDAMGGANGFVIGADAPDEAVLMLEYFTRAENLQKYFDVFPGIPTVKEVNIDSPSMNLVKDYLLGAESFSLYPDRLFPQKIGTLINENSARIMLGERTPEEGCKILADEWENY